MELKVSASKLETARGDNWKQLLESFVTTIQGILSNADIKHEMSTIKCERCGKDAVEHRLSGQVSFRVLFFIVKKEIVAKMLYDPNCGLSYVRFEAR